MYHLASEFIRNFNFDDLYEAMIPWMDGHAYVKVGHSGFSRHTDDAIGYSLYCHFKLNVGKS